MATEWKATILEEIHALEKNYTWEISELPWAKQPVRLQMDLHSETKGKWECSRFKASLIAKGSLSPTKLTTRRPSLLWQY